MTNQNLQMVPYQRRNQQSMVRNVAAQVAPIVARAVAGQVVRSVSNSLPSFESVGRAARRLQNGYSAESNNSSSNQPSTSPMYSAPASRSFPYVSRTARISQSKMSTIVAHRELVSSSITGSTTWQIENAYKLQPGDSTTFPWLSIMAAQYKEYRFKALSFEYIPIAPTSTQGDVILSPDYDASSIPATSEQQALDHRDTAVDSCWKCIKVKLNVSDLHSLGPRKFIRTYLVPGDPKTYDSGTLTVSTNNQTGTSAIGKLFVHYVVEFFTPVLEPPGIIASNSALFFRGASAQTFTTGVSTLLQIDSPTGPFPFGITYSSGSWTMPRGVFKYTAILCAADTVSENFTAFITPKLNGGVCGAVSTALSGGPAAQVNQLVSIGQFASSGGDLFTLPVTMTGAAGVLTALINSVYIRFEVV